MSDNPVDETAPTPAGRSIQHSEALQIAGRGTIYITAAKGYFMLAGLTTYIILPRLLNVEEFGLYSVVVGIASIINAVVVTGTVQTVSKFISEDETLAETVKRKALQLQFLVGGGIALTYFLLSPVIASFLKDLRLTSYLRLTAFITLSYSLYAIFLGTLNGRREFFKQAMLDVAYSTFKFMWVVGLAWAGYGVLGALRGWFAASVCILIISIIVVGRSEVVGQIRLRDLVGFQTMILVFILIVNLLQKVDLLLVKALSSPDIIVASQMAGYYSAVMAIANVIFQSIIAIAVVTFPLISESTSKTDHKRTRNYISQTLRVSLMLMTLLAVLFSSNAEALLGLIYKPEYLAGADALRIIPLGMLFFGWLYILCTIISASGRPRIAVYICVVTILADALLNAWLIPRFHLVGAATATTVAMFLGAVIGSAYVASTFRTLLSWTTAIRILLAGGIVCLLSGAYSATGLMTLAKLAIETVAYGGLLYGLKEVGTEDLQSLKQIIRGHSIPQG